MAEGLDRRFLIIADAGDPGAHRVADRLARRHGPQSTRLASASEIAFASRVALAFGSQTSSSGIWLRDGAGAALAPRAVLCRATTVSALWAARASPADREYAAAEAHAILVAWLTALDCPVLNQPSGRGLVGPVLSDAEWLAAAARAGLPTLALRHTSNVREVGSGWVPVPGPGPRPVGRRPGVLCERSRGEIATAVLVGPDVVGPLPSPDHAAAHRLQAATQCHVLGLELHGSEGGSRVAAVTPLPPLDEPELSEAVAALLTQVSERPVAA